MKTNIIIHEVDNPVPKAFNSVTLHLEVDAYLLFPPVHDNGKNHRHFKELIASLEAGFNLNSPLLIVNGRACNSACYQALKFLREENRISGKYILSATFTSGGLCDEVNSINLGELGGSKSIDSQETRTERAKGKLHDFLERPGVYCDNHALQDIMYSKRHIWWVEVPASIHLEFRALIKELKIEIMKEVNIIDYLMVNVTQGKCTLSNYSIFFLLSSPLS